MKRYLESRTSDVVSKRARTVDRLQEAEQDVVEVKEEIKQMKDRVPQLELEIKQMKDKVAQSEQKVAQSEQKVAQSGQKVAGLEEIWKANPNDVNKYLLDQANEQLKQANEQLKQAYDRLGKAEDRLGKAEDFNRAFILSSGQKAIAAISFEDVVLPEHPQEWETSHVLKWSNDILVGEKHSNEDAQTSLRKLKNNGIIGKTVLTLTEEKLMQDGIPRGPATSLSIAIEELKKKYGIATSVLTTPEAVVFEKVLEHLGWTIENWKKKTPATLVTRRKKIYSQFEYQFRDREVALNVVKEVAESNYKSRLSGNHKEHAFLLVPGMSSIGKTRLGLEAPVAVKQLPFVENVLYAFIDLNNGERFSDKLDRLAPSARLGVRLVSCLFNIEMGNLMDLSESDLNALRTENVLDMVIKHHLHDDKNKVFAIVIHFDEYTFYIDDAMCRMGFDYVNARKYYKDMLRVVSRYMREGGGDNRGSFFILPLCTGTSPIDIEFLITGDRASRILELTPLCQSSAVDMFKQRYGNRPLCNDIVKQDHFLIGISDTMCIPGIVDWMISDIKDDVFGTSFNWSEFLYSKVLGSAAYTISSFGGETAAKYMLYFAFSGQIITRGYVLPGGTTVGDVERNGVVFLEHVKEGSNEQCRVMIPFVYCRWLNNQLGEVIIPDRILVSPTPAKPWLWQDFEELHLHFVAIRINSLMYSMNARIEYIKNHLRSLNTIKNQTTDIGNMDILEAELRSWEKHLQIERNRSFTLRDVIPSCQGDSKLLDTIVSIKLVKPYHEDIKFLTHQADKIESFSSISCVEQASQIPALDGVFVAASDNMLFDGRFCLGLGNTKRLVVLWQDKHSKLSTKDKTVSCAFIVEWYGKAYKATELLRKEGDEVALLFFTNRCLSSSSISSKKSIDLMFERCPRLLLITEGEIRGYLTPTFAHRGLIPSDADK